MEIKKEINRRKQALRQIKRRAAEELCTNGRTRYFRRLWNAVADTEDEIAYLEELLAEREPPTVGFTIEEPPDTDDDEDDDEEDEEDEEDFPLYPECTTVDDTGRKAYYHQITGKAGHTKGEHQ